MSAPKACCTLAPVSSDYKAEGSDFTLGKDLKIYETKDKAPKTVVICIYDIFGYHPNTKQFADKMSSGGGFRVVMPDFFRGQPFELAGFPPKDTTGLMKWVATKGSWDDVIKKDLLNVVEHYKKQGATSFGIYGFCWGGKMAMKAVSDMDKLVVVKAAAAVHPWNLETSDAEAVKRPCLLLPSKDEDDLTPMYDILKKKLGDDKTGHRRFDDMFHGFAAARGDWKEELQRKRADEAIQLVCDFMKKHVAG